ncbi:MAG: hypothetical protein ACRDD1_18240 [Planctomycetia bacterium]
MDQRHPIGWRTSDRPIEASREEDAVRDARSTAAEENGERWTTGEQTPTTGEMGGASSIR